MDIAQSFLKREARRGKRPPTIIKSGVKLVKERLGDDGFQNFPCISWATLWLVGDGELVNPNTKVTYMVKLGLTICVNSGGTGRGTARTVILDVPNRCFLGLSGEKSWYLSGNADRNYPSFIFRNEKEVIDKLIVIIQNNHKIN
jgi:hypothetical protein